MKIPRLRMQIFDLLTQVVEFGDEHVDDAVLVLQAAVALDAEYCCRQSFLEAA